jgi:predicted nucleic acid-binding protein
MNYLLDTNVISEMRKDSRMKASSPKMDRRVEEWVKSVSAPDLHLSVISILELERGFHLLIRRDPVQAEVILLWVRNKVLPSFEGRILAIDLAIARRCAALVIPNPIEYRDSLIAATALVHGMTVVTRNVRHFVSTGVTVFNPWDN